MYGTVSGYILNKSCNLLLTVRYGINFSFKTNGFCMKLFLLFYFQEQFIEILHVAVICRTFLLLFARTKIISYRFNSTVRLKG